MNSFRMFMMVANIFALLIGNILLITVVESLVTSTGNIIWTISLIMPNIGAVILIIGFDEIIRRSEEDE